MRVNYIENTDCLIGMHEIPDESVDCVVTDCPYLLVGGGLFGRRVSHQEWSFSAERYNE